MYKLAIIEDEDFIRDNLAKIIINNIPDFEVSGLYENAYLIIDEIESFDVIISDIKMPVMSGIELAEHIYTNRIKTKLVLISAYSDFEYAKQALKYGVYDYLNKPIKIGELKNVFEKLKLELDEKNIHISAERKNFYSNLAIGSIINADFEVIAKKVEPNLDVYNDSVCIYELLIENYDSYIKTTWHYEKDSFLNALYNFLDFEDVFISRIMLQSEDRIIVLVADKKAGASENSILSRIKEAHSALGLTISVFDKIPLKNLATLLENNTPIMNTITVRREQGQLLFSLLLEKNLEAAISVAKKIVDTKKVFYEISKRLQSKLPYINEISAELPYELWINEIISAIDNSETANDTISQIQAYVCNNYQNDISLVDVSQKFYFNKAYLGRLFKEKTGESFNDFLIKTRMKKAKELLKNSQYKIYEVSTLVGYKSTKYFNKIFYAYYGVTPTEYRKGESRNELL